MNFQSQLAPAAEPAANALGTDLETIMAVAALETGFGKSAPGNNFFGIKGRGQTQSTTEFFNGRKVRINDSFRAYASPEESIGDFASLILRRYPDAVGKRGRAFFAAMKRGGYATDPKYEQKLTSIYKRLTSGRGA